MNSISETQAYFPYVVDDFQSEISINRDTSLDIKEKIEVTFNESKHGIFRTIPVIYSANGRTIRAKLNVKSVTDEIGKPYKYEVSWLNESRKIKIGDPDKTLTGKNTYIINYKITKVLQRYDGHDELYWNVTGHEWDTQITKTTVKLSSPFANITKTKCISGIAGGESEECVGTKIDNSANTASYEAKFPLGNSNDMTITIALNPQNSLNFPNKFQKAIDIIMDNWGYAVAAVPFLLMLYFWIKKGRDKRYLSDNIYVKVKNAPEKTTAFFEHKILGQVYSPIAGLTPSQIGTIIDQRVDTKDVVAEIVELARLGYFQIKKVTKKRFIGTSNDYAFISNGKDLTNLNNYQKYLFESLFNSEAIADSKKDLEGFKINGITDTVLLSSLKNNFYKYLEVFKDKLYKNVADKSYFDGNPDGVVKKYAGLFIAMSVAAGACVLYFASISGDNFGPLSLLGLLLIPGMVICKFMPRRTAWGYSLLNQINSLKYFISVGKWRQEIAEKNMFLEEILPIAISLGIVDKLARDMKDLGLPAPKYIQGMPVATFGSDFNSFTRSSVSNIVSSPHQSGSSSWSGGSGFSGGSSGGGFGGGGGGSW